MHASTSHKHGRNLLAEAHADRAVNFAKQAARQLVNQLRSDQAPLDRGRRGEGRASKRVLVIGRLDRALPGAVELLQHLLGGRAAAIDDAVERLEVTGLVAAEMIEMTAPAQARMCERQALLGDLEQIAIPDARLEAQSRHVIA